MRVLGGAFRACFHRAHLWQVVGLSGSFPAFVVCSVPLSLPFVPLLHSLSCNSPILCLVSHFKGVFSAVWEFRVGLCCLRALRGLWGFCVRE